MGHSVNPVGMRLMSSRDWEDSFINPSKFYPEVLHSTFHVRKFVDGFFIAPYFYTNGYAYSHCILDLGYNSYVINVYIYDGQIEEDVNYLVSMLTRKAGIYDLKYNRRHFPTNNAMKNDIGDRNQGVLVDSRYYNFIIARKILVFITFFSRYLTKLYSYTRKNRYNKYGLEKKYKFWKNEQWDSHKYGLAYLFNIRFKRYYSKRREFMFILALNKFLWKDVLLPLKNNKINKAFHSYKNKEFFDLRVFLMMVEIFHRVIISTAYNYNSTYSIYPIWKFNTLNIRMRKIYYLLVRYYYTIYVQPDYYKKLSTVVGGLVWKMSFLHARVRFFGITNDDVSAIFLARYLSKRLEQRYTWYELMKPLKREMKLLGHHFRLITGYKLQFSGRLVRRDRSRTAFVRGGSLPASTYMRYAEHAFTLSYLRNGACSIRVWLYRTAFAGGTTRYTYYIW